MVLFLLALTGCVRVLTLDGDGESDSCVPGEAEGFAMPDPRWALASLHAERTLDRLPDSALSGLDAEWFLASAWQISDFRCDDYGPPWNPADGAFDQTGCLAIADDVVWIELCRLFPGRYDCDAWPDAVRGDQIEAQVMALTWFTLSAHALLGRYDVDPDDFVTDPDDPQRLTKVHAIAHFRTPWFAFEGCDEGEDGFDTCLDVDLERHVDGVQDKLERFASAPCFEGALTEADVRAYAQALARIQPDPAWPDAEEAAVAALTTERFVDDAAAVLDAFDTVPTTRLSCPEAQLWSFYTLPCP